MSLSDLITPVVADQLAKFGPGTAGKAAQLNYDVPLPGAYAWDRIVELGLPEDWFVDASRLTGQSLVDLGIVKGEGGRVTAINHEQLATFYRKVLPSTVRPSLSLVAEVGGDVSPMLAFTRGDRSVAMRIEGAGLASDATGGFSGSEALLERRRMISEPEDLDVQRVRVESYVQRLAERQGQLESTDSVVASIVMPAPGVGHSIRPVTINPTVGSHPRLALVETWELRSYLGDYGLGRTLQTFSLLPGERTTISTQTWRNDAMTREDASSIFDSSDTAAQTRFTSAMTRETGSAFQDQGGWALSISTSANVGFNVGVVNGQFGLSAGFAANHQEASQRWSNQVSTSAAEHAAQVNNSRRQSVESSSNSTTASGSLASTVREISNTNLRRVLNFVFRELNQTYDTYVVLRDVKVAFYNGRVGSADVVPLADLGRLLERHVLPANRDQAARFVLSMCAQRLDFAGELVTTLQVGSNPNGVSYQWDDAAMDAKGNIVFNGDPIASDVRWRIKPGALSTADRTIKGVIMDKSGIVLRTDNVVVEALLGQADALDPYASALQALDLQDRASQIRARDADTQRTDDALALVAAQASDERIAAWEKLFVDEPEIQVVPVAAVSNGHTPQ